jgi:hypothetical protein
MRIRSTARTGESKFIDDHVAGVIDDHVAGADGQVGLPIVEIANCNGDRQAGQKRLLWRVEDSQGAALQPGVINRSGASLAPQADSVAN